MDPRGLSPWLADLAANVLCVVMIVLAALATMPAQAPHRGEVLPMHHAPALSGAEMVDMLRQRLLPGVASVDLADRWPIPLGQGQAIVFVFDHRHHAALVLQGGGNWPQMDVPQALRRGDGMGFSDRFLALAPLAKDPEIFRRALIRLLGQGRTGSNASSAAVMSLRDRAGRMLAWSMLGLSALVVVVIWHRGRQRIRA